MEKKILKCKKVLLGKELEEKENLAILIEDDIIKDIFPEEKLVNHKDIEIIDMRELTVMPGMIDCHSHLNIDANLPEHLELLSWSNECELTLISLKGLEDDLLNGITTIRCLGDKYYTDVTLKEKVENNEVIGPRVLSSGLGIKGLHGSGYIGYPHCGIEDVRKTVRENLKRKVETIKLFITPGQPPKKGKKIPSFLSYEEIKTAVDEAKKLDIPVAAHCIGGEGLKNCLLAGVKVLEHLYAVTDEEVEEILKYGSWADLTPGIFMDEEREEFLSESNVKAITSSREYVIECMKKIVAKKVPFTLGTDAYHGKLYKELLFAETLGAEKKDVIKAITSNAAIICGLEDTIGQIEIGCKADIIGVAGNPYENFEVLKNIEFVMKDGRIYKS